MNTPPPPRDPFQGPYEQDPYVRDHFSGRPLQGNRLAPLPDSSAVLVLGILSILGSFCYGIFGLILSIIALALSSKPQRLYRMDPHRYTVSSYNNMRAGKICAIIGLSISILFILVVVIAVIFAIEEERRGYYYY